MGEQKTGTVFVRTRKDRNYTVIDNTFLRDDRLSAQAKGVFAYILYLPEDWCIYQSELVNHFSNGRDALRSAIKELEEFGYISKEHKKDEKTGRFTHWQYTVNEVPVSPKTDCPKTEIPTLENPTLLNTDEIINTNNTNSSPTKLESEPPKLSDFTNNETKKSSRSKKPTKTEQTEQYLSSLPIEEYMKSRECAQKLVNYLVKLQNSTTAAKNLKSWQRDFAQFATAENKDFNEILKVIDFVFNDNWWSSRVSSASMIIKNYGMLFQRMNGSSKPRYQNPRTTGGMDYHKQMEHYDIKY